MYGTRAGGFESTASHSAGRSSPAGCCTAAGLTRRVMVTDMRTLLPARCPGVAWLAAAALIALLLGGGSAAPAVADDDRWTWPLDPRPEVVHRFEPPPDPYAAGHRGVDLAGAPGQTVLAVAPGQVRFAGRVAGRGVVVVQHGSERSTYQPVTAWVKRGDPVTEGQPLGRLETVGSHCWPAACLHLGRVRGETYLDPLELLGGGPVRLLPWEGLPVGEGPALPRLTGPPAVAAAGAGSVAAGIALATAVPGTPG